MELTRYLGKWYDQGRYDASFQKGCDGVTAEYSSKEDGNVAVVNTCREGSAMGTTRTAGATARVVEGSAGAKLKVTFFQPFEGDYWVLDRAPDYSWSIVGEPSGKYLWILTRRQQVYSKSMRGSSRGRDLSDTIPPCCGERARVAEAPYSDLPSELKRRRAEDA